MSKIYLEDFHFQARRDTAENWNANNPILCDGEFGIIADSTDENWLKVGDGVTPWKSLSFRKGPKGDTGAKGETGATGAKGDKGAEGDKGDKGDAFTYEDFTAEQLAALKGAKGVKGEKGDKGDAGDVNTLQMNTACANALRGAASGSAIRLTDVSPNEHTLGVKVRGKNLLDPSLYHSTVTSRGVTYTANGDTIALTGTATASSYVNIFGSNPDAVIPLPSILQNKKIKLYTYGNSETIELLIIKTTSTTVSANTNRAIDTTGATGFSIRCRFTSGNTYNDSIKFMITEEGIENNPPYTPYISDLSTVTVTRCRKNLIPYPYYDTTKTQNGITFTVNSDGSVTVSGTATAQAYFRLQQSFSLKKGQYFFSGCPKGGTGTTYSLYLSTSDYVFYKADIGNGISINSEDDKTVSIVINIAKDTTVENLVFKPQLELGSTATAYEPYTAAEYTPAADGTVSGVKSLYPTTTLMTDTEGAIIDAKYNRDINKAFAEMQQAILSIGGNV